ncbi:unnamed protein product [Linum trigynum]|uniref:Agglutinin domain-containing protein n=1 Tax=Linum trigynum TaxID=586398 RepID=A0AAV2ECX1_9ROSI
MAQPPLPRYVVLKCKYNNKYMRYTHEDVQQHGLLQFTGEQAVSPYAKFQVEPSKTVSGLVHLRCTYNNKYWVRWSETQYWISGGADNPEEDQSKWSCTLFKPVFVEKDDHKTVRFLHVQLNHYACLFRSDPPFGNFVYAGWEEPNSDLCDVCHEYLEFSGSDLGDPSVGNEVFTNPDGSIRIKSDYFNKFWRRSPNWIWGDSSDSTAGNADTLFWPVKVGKSIVALRNYGNNYFCKRLTTEGKTSCLNAGVSTISREAQIGVEELVISRSIYDVDFRLMDARIYDQSIVTMATGVASNGTSNPNTAKVKLSYTDTKSSTWSGGYTWGETNESSNTLETEYEVSVKPMSLTRISLLATRGSCDIPYSYTQRDTLTNGSQVAYRMDDGVYTGINSFNFKYETKEEKLVI